MTTNAQVSPVASFFGAALMAVGGLIAVLSGLCSLGFLAVLANAAFSNSAQPVTAQSIPGLMVGLLTLVSIDAIPVGFGVMMFVWGRAIRRGPPWRAPRP